VSPGWAGARRRYSVDARELIGKLTARTAGAERAVGDAASGAGSPVPEKG
jgi:hypothetical protein